VLVQSQSELHAEIDAERTLDDLELHLGAVAKTERFVSDLLGARCVAFRPGATVPVSYQSCRELAVEQQKGRENSSPANFDPSVLKKQPSVGGVEVGQISYLVQIRRNKVK